MKEVVRFREKRLSCKKACCLKYSCQSYLAKKVLTNFLTPRVVAPLREKKPSSDQPPANYSTLCVLAPLRCEVRSTKQLREKNNLLASARDELRGTKQEAQSGCVGNII
ncbi:hypothetical protein [Parasegetibacter sp. NRK P23]|uniref:hypothetical protein n=1 Tax=Parasegetibacter sp. NRK P23 TaxID=2942999 RepID=UPI002043DC14|nr:hypothetical protein [Parasegetibacter sp. NRK P23]MCM5527229.1 hypothetical protein [Parasegetibacter sp. NRK P23]